MAISPGGICLATSENALGAGVVGAGHDVTMWDVQSRKKLGFPF